MSIKASQKAGVENPTNTRTETARSHKLFCLTAARTPRGTAIRKTNPRDRTFNNKGVGQPLADFFKDRPIVFKRPAEIEPGEAPEPPAVLHVPGLVQVVGRGEFFPLLHRRHPGAEVPRAGREAAGGEAHHQEGHEGDAHQDHRGQRQTAKEKGGHWSANR
jgi:hypothetical protein